MRRRSTNRRVARSAGARKALSNRLLEARVRGFAAINRVRRGQSKTLSSAARAENTTVKSIRRLLSSALIQDRPGGHISVKAGARYSARVEILTRRGTLPVNGTGSRERGLVSRIPVKAIRMRRSD